MASHSNMTLKKLAEQASRLTGDQIEPDYILHRNVEQIEDMSKKLLERADHVSGAKNQAHYLLAKQGFDADKLSRNFNSINLKTFEPIEIVHENDIETFLKHEHDYIILTAIEEAKKETISDFDKKFISGLEGEWEKKKSLSLEAFSAIQTPTPQRSVIYLPPSSSLSTQQQQLPYFDSKLRAYAPVIIKFNANRKSGQFGMVSSLKEAAEKNLDIRSNLELIYSWELLRKIINENDVRDGKYTNSSLKINQYANKPDIRLFIKGARSFLEEQYCEVIKSKLRSHPKIILGGNPEFIKLIESYLNVLELNNPWALVYYCIRCGKWNEAITNCDDKFRNWLQKYHQNDFVLPENESQVVESEYRSSKNPFQKAVLNIIGRFQDENIPEVFHTTQDYMWYKLCLITDGLNISRKKYELSVLQKKLCEYGLNYFKKPLLYFQVLLLSLQFERAVKFLYEIEEFVVDTMHFAIALNHYGMLKQPPPSYPNQPTLDYAQSLHQFVRLFSKVDPILALYYYSTIHDEVKRNECISDLLLEFKEFELIFGTKSTEGKLSEIFSKEEVDKITEKVAEDLNANGKGIEAIRLYSLLASKQSSKTTSLNPYVSNMLSLLIRQLGRNLLIPGHERDSIEEISNDIYHSSHYKNMDKSLWNTFEKMFKLLHFFKTYQSGRYFEALNTIESLEIIPFQMQDIDRTVEIFNSLNEAIKSKISEILLATMDILTKLYNNLKSAPQLPISSFKDLKRDEKISELKLKARVLVVFSGMIKFKMPGETNARLIKMEVFMN